MAKAQKYYKKRYGIGIYKKISQQNPVDEFVALFDNVQQFADYFGKSLNNAYAILNLHWEEKQTYIFYKGQIYELAFIDMLEEDQL